MTPGEADPPGPDGLHLLTALHPAAHTPLLHHRAWLDLPGRPLLRLHLPHHDRTGWLHPWRPSWHGAIPDFLQNLRRPLPPLRTGPDLPHSHRILRHSSAQSGTTSPPTQVTCGLGVRTLSLGVMYCTLTSNMFIEIYIQFIVIAGISLQKILDQNQKDLRLRLSRWRAIKHKFQTTKRSDESIFEKKEIE